MVAPALDHTTAATGLPPVPAPRPDLAPLAVGSSAHEGRELLAAAAGEHRRLKAIADSGLLEAADDPDHPDDPHLEALCAVAATVMGTRMAGVSIIDATRHVFAAGVGLPVRELPRCDSFCSVAMATPAQVLVIRDARTEPAFRTNPLVAASPGVRAYAGAPLVLADGTAIGALCVSDSRPRLWTDAQVEALATLAAQVMVNLQLRSSLAQAITQAAEREQQAAALVEIQRYLDGVVRHTDSMIYVKDRQGRFLLANPALHDLLGVEPGALLGADGYSVFPPEISDEHREHDHAVLSGLVPVSCREQAPHPDGTLHSYQSTKFPLVDGSGAPYALGGISVDVTELAGLQAEQAATLEALAEGVVVIDRSGSIRAANRAAESLFDLRGQGTGLSIMSPHWARVWRDGSPIREGDGPLSRCLRTGEQITAEVIGLHRVAADGSREGQLRWISFSARPLRHPGELRPYAIVASGFDVTATVTREQRQEAAAVALRTVVRATEDLLAAVDRSSVLRVSGDWMTTGLQADAVCVLVGEPAASADGPAQLRCVEPRGLPGIEEGHCVDDSTDSAVLEVVVGNQPVLLDAATSGRLPQALREHGLTAALLTPVPSASGRRAVMVAGWREDPGLDPFLQEAAAVVSAQTGRVLDGLEQLRDATEQAVTDVLTGLQNRRGCRRALASSRPGDAVGLIDLDHFKKVNDTYGHQVGDYLLSSFSAALKDSARALDTVGRWGGEEFLVILNQSGAAGISAIERLQARWRNRGERILGWTSFSAGLVTVGEGERGEDALARADIALYRAKAAGRDRVVTG